MRISHDKINFVYSPRIRLWEDISGEFNLGGEPDGFSEVMMGVKLLHRGIRRRVSIPLVSSLIPDGRCPSDSKPRQIFSTLKLIAGMGDNSNIIVNIGTAVNSISITLTPVVMPVFYMSIAEAMDGEGDYSLKCFQQVSATKESITRLWFWGYANLHGVSGF